MNTLKLNDAMTELSTQLPDALRIGDALDKSDLDLSQNRSRLPTRRDFRILNTTS